MNAPHDFGESLARSHSASDLPIWEGIYRQAFPSFLAMIDHRQDGEHQRAGIDRSVVLSNSKQILIDEKARFRNRNGKVYDDIALEYWSDYERRERGWVCKPLRCDFIAYAIVPLGKCYLLPTIQLQIAWTRFGPEWVKTNRYPRIETRNEFKGRRWTTISRGIPPEVVFGAIGSALQYDFEPIGGDDSPFDVGQWVSEYESAESLG